MAVNRTPPQNDKETLKERTSLLQCQSELDMEEQKNEYENVSRRTNKRRALKTPPQTEIANASNIGDVMQEMRTLFSSLAAQQDLRFRELQATMQKQNEEIMESINFLSDKYDVALNQIESLQKEKKDDRKRIVTLEERVDYLEKKTCASTIEIRNVPKLISDQNKFEGKVELHNFVLELGGIVDAEIKDTDIKDIYRIKAHEKSNGIGTIIAEFSTVLRKEKVLTAIKKINKGKEISDKLHTGYFNFKGDKKPIYVSESVTKRTAKLFSQVREFAKTNGYTCWIFRGTVFLCLDDSKRVQIKSEHDLDDIKIKKWA